MSSKKEENGKRLDTSLMQEKLKGDSFPQNWDEFLDDNIRLFFDQLFEQTQQKKSDVIRKANISRTYGYQLMDGRRLGKRDYYILIAIAMSLDLKTTQRMLAIANCGPLHPLIKRDAAIIFALNHGFDNEKTYEFMCSLDLPPLDDGTEEE
ncbi:hypothetical protein EII17_00195 [Clostridiales bacterium COT073_COT-073]|nr:hypothetical protein EII17_00195 [Clostridiales bacterium COT073_COT-073]